MSIRKLYLRNPSSQVSENRAGKDLPSSGLQWVPFWWVRPIFPPPWDSS